MLQISFLCCTNIALTVFVILSFLCFIILFILIITKCTCISTYSNGGYPFGWGIANALVFKKVRAALGLDRANITLSGAAPMMKETIDYFLQFNIIITEVYGMSECSGNDRNIYYLSLH